MNGIHDLGGMHGFGPVERDGAEPVFGEPWQGRVFAMALLAPFGVRRLIETLPPAQYLASAYYERWLAALEDGLLASGAFTPEEVDARAASFAERPAAPVPRREDSAAAAETVAELRQHVPLHEEVGVRPRFGIGDAVRARNLHPRGTRGSRATHAAGWARSSVSTASTASPTPPGTARPRDRSPCTACASRRASYGARTATRATPCTSTCGRVTLSPPKALATSGSVEPEPPLRPARGARVVARAWVDPAYLQRSTAVSGLLDRDRDVCAPLG
ncbi:MAG TPA: hypothetical protein VFX49_22515 [Chloroflexota bacterium]|nr:hypothetical protein [Chloroflexota bacterium]